MIVPQIKHHGEMQIKKWIKIRHILSHLSAFLCIASLVFIFACNHNSTARHFRDADFNADWTFHLGDIPDPFDVRGQEGEWISVHLPHDWSIIDYEIQDSLHVGPFHKNLPGGADVGYLRHGTAWYRKEFVTPDNSLGKHIVLGFDGVQTQMELWVNGSLVGEHVYGYTPFHFDITGALKGPGELNVIALKTVNPGENSRWFAGAGIYRTVSISLLEPVAIAPWGVFVTTPDVSIGQARVNFETEVVNKRETEVELSGEILISTPGNEEIRLSMDPLAVDKKSQATFTTSCIIDNPILWNIHQANLYSAEVVIYADGKEVDSYHTTFGIRSIAYTVEDGFLLNGKEILMKGACMHHDNGLLGAAAFADAEFRRVKRMKENGYNAIRCSHNPPSEAFLNACDELGMLVIDESFDHWIKPKRPNDYSNYFEEWHVKDIQAMVYRDRNHPSVVMWSFGNEVQERADPEGIEIGKALVAAIREVDPTRPVTQAVCEFWDNPGKEWNDTEGAFSILDVGGYNYQFQKYELDHMKFPERKMYGSESVPQHAWENWEMVKRLPYVYGDFVWTGMDYIGESSIGHHYLVDQNAEQQWQQQQAWPWYLSWCGDIDILGNKKAQSFYRDVLWGESKLELMVSTPIPQGKESRLSYWGWYDEEKHWNWEGHTGKPMEVKVYSSYPQVKLVLNGKEIAVEEIDSLDKFTAHFELPFEPGELKAVGMLEGEEMEVQVLKTSGPASQLVLDGESSSIIAHRNSLAFINVQAADQEGLLASTNGAEVRVKVSGPAVLQAAGNAGPLHQGSFTDETFHLFKGRAMVIVRSTGEPGTIGVDLSTGSLGSKHIILEAN